MTLLNVIEKVESKKNYLKNARYRDWRGVEASQTPEEILQDVLNWLYELAVESNTTGHRGIARKWKEMQRAEFARESFIPYAARSKTG